MAFYFSQKSIYDIFCLEPSVILMIFFTPNVLLTYTIVLSPKEEEFNDSNSHLVDASHSVKQQNPAGTY